MTYVVKNSGQVAMLARVSPVAVRYYRTLRCVQVVPEACEGSVMRSLWDRVWPKVDMSGGIDACWLWTGALSLKRRKQKRPVIRRGRRDEGTILVSRQVCEWYHGPPPSEVHEAGHTCPDGENCICVNPRHLQWMTREENERHKQMMARRVNTNTL